MTAISIAIQPSAHGSRLPADFTFASSRYNGCRLVQIAGAEPSTKFASQVVEQLGRAMDGLPDPSHRVIAWWKLEGRSNPEITQHLDCSLGAVDRKLRFVRKELESELLPPVGEENVE